ncbi:MAG: winged helix DNA-binding domain-containing protein [Gammaproteobacteria bacterium]|nr:winged helix DNA-binding domain-containing protein [Gammaproteobacteria bacterium]
MLNHLRRLTLQQQGLSSARPYGKGKQAALNALEHLGYIQIDTLAVIERAHHHTLWTRIPDYQPSHLYDLVAERQAFEYWYHAASYLPMRDYRYAMPQMMAVKRGEFPYLAKAEKKYLNHVMERIRLDGPLKARDFDVVKRGSGSWWNWKPSKLALETLFMQGELMVTGREGMEKVYDLRERVLPDTVETAEPTLHEFAEYLLDTTIRAYGFTTLKQLTHLRQGKTLRNALTDLIQNEIEQGALTKISADSGPVLYTTTTNLDAKLKRPAANVKLLSPFDNAIIHRDRIQRLFNFDYKMECYVAKEKRQFGYFCLPILYDENFVGRVDCKAHRNTGKFELISLHIEAKDLDHDRFVKPFTQAIHRLAVFNNCETILVGSIRPKKVEGTLRKALG